VFRQAQQPPKRLLKNIDLICAKFPAEKKQTLLWPKRLLKRRNFIDWPKCLLKKVWLLFLPKPTPKKDKPILKTYKANHEQNWSHETKPIKTKIDQNQSRKTLTLIFATRWNQIETLPIKETLLSKKPRTCPQGAVPKPACWKNIDQNTYLKNTTAKNWIWFFISTIKRNLRIKDGFVFGFGSAPQRFALPACGRAWTMFEM